MARKLVSCLFTSVDGIVSAPNEFQLDSFDDGVGELMGSTIGTVDDVILGRVSYQEWAGFFPTSDDPFAAFINPVAKHVASRTLTQANLTWQNSTLVEGELEDFVRALKQGEGRDISVSGSISVVRQMVLAGLMDELILVVHPVIAGHGRRLFDDTQLTRLELLDCRRTEKGNAILSYGPRA